MKDAELVFPRVTHNPKIKTALLLVIPPPGTERFETLDFGLDIIGFQVKMHPFFRNFLIIGLLQKDGYLGRPSPVLQSH